MCIFRAPKTPDPTPLPAAPPIMSRTNQGLQSQELPTKKDLVDPDEVKGVEYGTTQKKSSPGAGKKTGVKALRIPLNTGTAGGGAGGVST